MAGLVPAIHVLQGVLQTLYIAFAEDHTSGFSTAGGQTVNFRTQDSLWIGRIGATYRWGATP